MPRRIAVLGGTTTWRDCLVALGYLCDRWRLVKGPAIAAYEQAFAQHIGVRYAVSFASGRVGLYGLLRALGIGAGDEVLLSVPTHIVVPNAVRYTGAHPVYVDCEPDTWGMDLREAEKRVTPRTKALVLQHTFGIPVDIGSALRLADQHGLRVIEDCVHALGAAYDGRQVGSLGVAGFFSTEETKTISTTMGGMIVTDDGELAGRMRAYQRYCASPSAWLTARYMLKLVLYHAATAPSIHWYTNKLYTAIGRRQWLAGATSIEERQGRRPPKFDQRLSNAQAALGLRQLGRLEKNIAHRRSIAAAYGSRLAKIGLRSPSSPSNADPAPLRYPLLVEDREAVVRELSPSLGVGTWFTSVLEEADSPVFGDYEDGTCPTAEYAARHLINLPTHPRVSPKDVEWIVEALAAAAGDRTTPPATPGGTLVV